MQVLAVIPARGGSKGIPRKNIYPLCGRPLIAYTVDAALHSCAIDRVVVSTDDAEIADISCRLGAEVRMRPAALSKDDTPTRAVLGHVVGELTDEAYAPDAILTLQPTSPLRTALHIDEAVAMFAADRRADSLVSCIEVPHVFHPESVMRRTGEGYIEPFLSAAQPHRRQDKQPVFARNGAAIYITRTPQISEYIFGGRLLAYLMDITSSIDVDTFEDLLLAEQALRSRG